MKLRTGKTVRGGREPPLGERRTGASFLPFAEKRKRSQPQTFFTLQYFFTKPRGNAAGLCTPQRRLFKRKPPCGKRRRPIYGALYPTLPRAWYGRRTRDKTKRQLCGSSKQRAYATGRDGSFAKARDGGSRNRTRRQAVQKSHPPSQNIAHSPKPQNLAHSPKTANVHNKKRLVSAIPQNALSTAAPRLPTRGGCLSFSFPSQTNYFLSTKTE